MSVWRWADWLEPVSAAARITLGEGDTPLVRSRHIGPREGLDNLFFKVETANPTGSYKDRFAAVAISHMVDQGRTTCVATSSGNTGSALAAYCAAADLSCEIAVVETAPDDKLRQMMAYGANIYRVRGFGLDGQITHRAFEALMGLARQPGCALQISAFCYSPAGMSGVQSISYELAEQMPGTIDHVFVPAGGGGLAWAVAKGFQRLVQEGHLDRSPKIECVQPLGNDTIAGPLREGAQKAQPVDCTTQIGGLQVPSILDGNELIEACRKSGGTGHLVEDALAWNLQARLAREEGIFCEPAAAVALAGAVEARRRNELDGQAPVVCLVTGSAFKDVASVEQMLADRSCPMVELDQLEERAETAR